jgi:hypothetical protein
MSQVTAPCYDSTLNSTKILNTSAGLLGQYHQDRRILNVSLFLKIEMTYLHRNLYTAFGLLSKYRQSNNWPTLSILMEVPGLLSQYLGDKASLF